MTTVSVDFDPADAALAANPFPVLKQLRSACPVARSEAAGGFWVITRYQDIKYITLHPELFSSSHTNIPKDVGFGEDIRLPPQNLDPPEHTVSKQRLTPFFVPAEVAQHAEMIRGLVTRLLDERIPRGRFDASRDFAGLMSTSTVCRVVGLPDEPEMVIGWLERFFDHEAGSMEGAHAAVAEVFMFLMAEVQAARETPRPDVLSRLAGPDPDGSRLEDIEVISTSLIVLFAGIETTWSTLAGAIHHLATHPDDQQRLRDDPTLIESAREEFLRVFTPISPARRVVCDIELGGQQLRAGDMVWLSLSSANRDEEQFEDSDAIVLDRVPNRHVAFGNGVHRCLGLNLARLELTIALEELLRRVPPFRLAEPDQVTWTTGVSRGAKNVVIEFDAPTANSPKQGGS